MPEELQLLGLLLEDEFNAALKTIRPDLWERLMDNKNGPEKILASWKRDFYEVCGEDLRCLRERYRCTNWLRNFCFDGLSDVEGKITATLIRFCEIWHKELD